MKLALALLATAATTARADAITEVTLANGVRVVLAPDPSVSDVVVYVRAPAGLADGDAAELVERAIDRADLVDTQLDPIGGWSLGAIARDHASYTIDVPAEALELALFLEARRLARVTAEEARAMQVELERDRRVAEGTREGMIAHALGGTVATTGLDEILRDRYAPANLVVVIAGKLDEPRARRAVARYFGSLPARPAKQLARPATPIVGTLAGTAIHDHRADRLTIAFALPDPLTAARADLDVAARVLAMRMAKRLAGTGLEVRVDAPFVTEAQTRGKLTPAMRDAIVAALGQLRDTPIAADELARATALLELDEVTALEGLAYRAQALATAPHYRDAWRARLRAVTAASIAASAAVWLAEGRAVTIAGDAP